MSTTAKGNSLEEQVHSNLESWIRNHTIPAPFHLCRIHRKKAYYSILREAEIAFENVVEVISASNVEQDGAQPTIVFIFECKNHERAIDAPKIEEFAEKLNTPFGFRTKGFMITGSSFTTSARNVAKSRGIGLAKFVPSEKLHMVMYHMTPDLLSEQRTQFPRRATKALIDADYESYDEDQYCADRGYLFDAISKMLSAYLKAVS